MPQPLKTKLKNHPNTAFFLSGGLANRPGLAVDFSRAIEEFAICEGVVGDLYLVLNAHRPSDAFKELVDSTTFSARVKMVKDCSDSLSNEDRAIVLAAVDKGSKAAGQRNKIAHGRWGYSEALPDAVLLTPGKQLLRNLEARLSERLGNHFTYAASEEGVMVYDKRDFDAISEAVVNATIAVDLTVDYLMNEPPAQLQIRDMILSDPDTRAKYENHLAELIRNESRPRMASGWTLLRRLLRRW